MLLPEISVLTTEITSGMVFVGASVLEISVLTTEIRSSMLMTMARVVADVAVPPGFRTTLSLHLAGSCAAPR